MGDFLEIFINLFELGWKVIVLSLIFGLLGYLIYDGTGSLIGLGLGVVIGLTWRYISKKQ